jgi:ketosteroid isomerase-like protein
MDQAFATDFAQHWKRDWNAHDLDALLRHFADDVVFRSRGAAQILPDSDGVVRGKDALRAYWAEGLRLIGDLHFEVDAVYTGIDTLVINYTNQRGNKVCEVLTFGDDGLVVSGQGTYLTDSVAAATGAA